MLLIRVGFSADLDPVFFISMHPDLHPGSQTDPDPDPGQTLKGLSHEIDFDNVDEN